MKKMWAGRSSGITDKIADDFNSSISFDKRLYEVDILGSMAHATMLAVKNIISFDEQDKILNGLQSILDDINSNALTIDENAEDIHMFIEQVLTERIGDAGKKLHTARSRNDQVALDTKMYLKKEIEEIIGKLYSLVSVITDKAEESAFSSVSSPSLFIVFIHCMRAMLLWKALSVRSGWSIFLCSFMNLSSSALKSRAMWKASSINRFKFCTLLSILSCNAHP